MRLCMHEQVRHRRRDVEALADRERGAVRRARVAVLREPLVGPRERVVAGRAHRAGTGSRPGWLASVQDSAVLALLPRRRVRRGVRRGVEVPRRARREVADDAVAVRRRRALLPAAGSRACRCSGCSTDPARAVASGGLAMNARQRAVNGLGRGGVVEPDRPGPRERRDRRRAVAELADLDGVVARRHAAVRRVADALGRADRVLLGDRVGHAGPEELEDDVVRRVVGVGEDVDRADAGAVGDGERALRGVAAARPAGGSDPLRGVVVGRGGLGGPRLGAGEESVAPSLSTRLSRTRTAPVTRVDEDAVGGPATAGGVDARCSRTPGCSRG